jgi:hypothetical protein
MSKGYARTLGPNVLAHCGPFKNEVARFFDMGPNNHLLLLNNKQQDRAIHVDSIA